MRVKWRYNLKLFILITVESEIEVCAAAIHIFICLPKCIRRNSVQDRKTTLNILSRDRFKIGNLVLLKSLERLKEQLLVLVSWNDFDNNRN